MIFISGLTCRVEIEIDEPDLLPTCSACTCEEGDEWICQYCEIKEELREKP